MKRIIAIAVLCIFALSCESEERVVKSAPENNLVSDPVLTGKLKRVVQSPTAADDFIDGTSCFAIQFPYSVIADGQEVTLASEADYQAVRDVLEASATGGGEVTINFPITVTYADYSEATLATQAQFSAAISSCTGSVELSCMGLAYPIGIKTYDSGNQLAESFDLGSKQALFEMLDNLAAYDGMALDYPVHFTAPDGTMQNINSNQELEEAIDSYTDECLALLNPEPDPTVQEIITQGTWYVSYYFSMTDQTATYQDYDFTFNTDTTLQAAGASPPTGTWDISGSGSTQQAEFTFAAVELEGIQGTWTIINVTETLIELHRESTGVEPEKFLSLSKN